MNFQIPTAEIEAMIESAVARAFDRQFSKDGDLATDRLLTENEVASMLHVEVHTIRDARRRGELVFVRVGRFPRFRRADIDAWLDSRSSNVGGNGSDVGAGAEGAALPTIGNDKRRNGSVPARRKHPQTRGNLNGQHGT